MEGKTRRTSNRGMLYHETQEGLLCGVHCLNAVLQGPFFTEVDLAEIAADLDDRKRQLMLQGASSGTAVAADMGDFLAEGQGSHNVSNHGDFSVQGRGDFKESIVRRHLQTFRDIGGLLLEKKKKLCYLTMQTLTSIL